MNKEDLTFRRQLALLGELPTIVEMGDARSEQDLLRHILSDVVVVAEFTK